MCGRSQTTKPDWGDDCGHSLHVPTSRGQRYTHGHVWGAGGLSEGDGGPGQEGWLVVASGSVQVSQDLSPGIRSRDWKAQRSGRGGISQGRPHTGTSTDPGDR